MFKTHQITIANRQIVLDLPADPEALLKVAAETEESLDPYWGILWDAAIHTAERILKFDWPPGTRALELGCGAGLVGIAGLMAGMEVTFSDVVPEAVELAVRNASANGFPTAKGQQINVHSKPTETFDVLMASDLLYDADLHASVLHYAENALATDGVFLLGDPGRQNADVFVTMARRQGWLVETPQQGRAPHTQDCAERFRLLKLTQV